MRQFVDFEQFGAFPGRSQDVLCIAMVCICDIKEFVISFIISYPTL